MPILDKLRTKLRERQLDDPRLLGVVLIAAVALSVVWNGVGIVQRNRTLQQKVDILEQQNTVLDLENSTKSLRNDYYKTAEFAELKARTVNGVADAGETVYIIDDETALGALKTPENHMDDTSSSGGVSTDKPQYQQNFEAWMAFFFGG